ncbi:MAG TPA: hypothetical protein VE907_09760 [Gammaproteobacteria bacterium]|nr:hypothetical protein [Gammaproteobacteria bacterium]
MCRISASVVLFAISLSAVAQQATPGLGEYLRDHWWGLSRDEVVSLFDAEAVPDLVAMLHSETPYCGAVVGMLVIVGDERAVDALIAFVETPFADPALANVYESARGAAIGGLGELVRRIGSERALTYLVDGLTPDVWNRRNVRGVAGWTKVYEEYDLLLSEYAIHGLAYSGDARAGEALRSLQRSPTPEQSRLRKGLDKTLEDWLEIHRRRAAEPPSEGLEPGK